jgi:hypothetical protein
MDQACVKPVVSIPDLQLPPFTNSLLVAGDDAPRAVFPYA